MNLPEIQRALNNMLQATIENNNNAASLVHRLTASQPISEHRKNADADKTGERVSGGLLIDIEHTITYLQHELAFNQTIVQALTEEIQPGLEGKLH